MYLGTQKITPAIVTEKEVKEESTALVNLLTGGNEIDLSNINITEFKSWILYKTTFSTKVILPKTLQILDARYFTPNKSSTIISLVLPDSLTDISTYGGDTVHLELYVSSLEKWLELNHSSVQIAIEIDKLYINNIVATSITIPSTITNIKKNAFYNCKSLTSVVVSNGVKSIGRSAFLYCDNLKTVSLPVSLTSVGFNAFNVDGISVSYAGTVEQAKALLDASRQDDQSFPRGTVISCSDGSYTYTYTA